MSNKLVNAEKLVFGGTLSKHHVANIEVNFEILAIFKNLTIFEILAIFENFDEI